MAKTELSNSKSICVLAVVVCCFAILWPKIFLPMLQSALSLSTAPNDNIQKSDSTMIPPKVREAMRLSRPDELRRLPGRPFQREATTNTNEIPRTGGLMGLVMPLYTIGIIVFFLYTILKMVFKNKSDKEEEVNELSDEETNKPVVNDFKMDPEYRKFILNDEYDENGKRIKCYENLKRKTKLNLNSAKIIQKSEKVLQSFGKDKVSKALHVLIRDMEEFKTKLLEAEQTSGLIVEETTINRPNSPHVCCDVTQKGENEKQNDLNEENKENLSEDNEMEENKENSEQTTETAIESQNETIDENEVNEDTNDSNLKEEYELKEKLLKNLESYYWESLLKGMNHLKHAKEE